MIRRLGRTVTLTIALVVAGALHLGLLAGLADERGAPLRAYAERAVLIENAKPRSANCICKPNEPLYRPSPGWADVQCRVDPKGYLEHCRWVREGEPGFGDVALRQMRYIQIAPRDPARQGGTVTFRYEIGVYPTA